MKVQAATLSLALLLLTPNALAVDGLPLDSLLNDCLSPPDTRVCQAYLQGFVDGAVATDPSVVQNVTDEISKSESLTERALRTRIGGYMDRFGESYFAGFCIPIETDINAVGEQIVAGLEAVTVTDISGRDFVYNQLKLHYPCGTLEE
ncbi:MAG: hypothetical protein NXH85_09105 [Pseudomonadaceae bacterium]|nr:hypothetical protein [Pseudomonadaceae bacterium]